MRCAYISQRSKSTPDFHECVSSSWWRCSAIWPERASQCFPCFGNERFNLSAQTPCHLVVRAYLTMLHSHYFLSENHSDLASPASTMLIASKWTSRWQMEIKPGKWTQIPLDMMYQWALGLGCVDAVQDLVHSAAGMAGLSSAAQAEKSAGCSQWLEQRTSSNHSNA